MKRVYAFLAALVMALTVSTATATTASAVTDSNVVYNRTGGTYVTVQYYTGAWFWPSNGSQVSRARCFKTTQVTHSQWGHVYWPNTLYCFQTPANNLYLYYGMK
jgi:hypothetical protein